MKVTLNLSKLLQDKVITQEEYTKLLEISKNESRSSALAILSVMGCIAFVLGLYGIFPDFFDTIIKSIYNLAGLHGVYLLAIAFCISGSYFARSGFLAGISGFAILGWLGVMIHSEDNDGLVALSSPWITILVFSGLAYMGLLMSRRFSSDLERLFLIFSRTCIIIINIAFWVGTICGDSGADHILVIPSIIYIIVWAFALLALGYWGARESRLFVVNTAAVFGAIHLYTQWFDRLGATPISLLFAGLLAVALAFGLRRLNHSLESTK